MAKTPLAGMRRLDSQTKVGRRSRPTMEQLDPLAANHKREVSSKPRRAAGGRPGRHRRVVELLACTML